MTRGPTIGAAPTLHPGRLDREYCPLALSTCRMRRPASATNTRRHRQSDKEAGNGLQTRSRRCASQRRRRGQAFYERIGYHIDHDHRVSDELRFVQITPPGSCCSIVIGNGITSAPPGSAQGLQVVVDDVEAAQAQLRDAGVEVGDVEDSLAGRFVFFSDPDGNGWAVQQFPARD
jgi:catechol 2,3-dioxygenase-like lactoylglutathione lyase family enzyme